MSDSSHAAGGTRKFTGWHMAAIMVAFFGVIIGVNLTMAMLAVGSWTGLVVKNSYVASQHFNETLEDAQRQKALGWTSALEYRDGAAHFALTDGAGRKLHGFAVTVRFTRPTHEHDDRDIALAEGPRDYEAVIDLAPGVWNAEAVAVGPEGRRHRGIFRLFVSQRG